MTRRKADKKPQPEVAVIDFETDPFKFDRVPAPFACGFMCRETYHQFWGPNCAHDAMEMILSIDIPLMIYAHNGGKFDFYFMWKYIENPVKIINGRIVSFRAGIHEFRDSWAIMPFSLATYKKTEIDYAKFEVESREANREEILSYLRDDCRDLKALCDVFVSRFGFKLTIAGTAMKELRKLHDQENLGGSHDRRFRKYYFGGRVECFETGTVTGDFKVYDVNSMYPAVMANYDHPIGGEYIRVRDAKLSPSGWIVGYPGQMYFATVEGENRGALPMRDPESNGLTFHVKSGTFEVVSHELRAALEVGKFKVTRIPLALIPVETQRFDRFVAKFSDEKKSFKKAGDRINELLSKYVLNSAYGKFGTDPTKYKEYLIVIKGVHDDPGIETEWENTIEADQWRLYSKPSPKHMYFDVAIAASVTAAARAVLLRAIVGAERPIYCDTDSLICEGLTGVPFSEYELGAWKTEAIADTASIGGKKLYALFDGGKPVKWACKGLKLTPKQIRRVAEGEKLLWQSEAPNFSLTGNTKFVSRTAKRTV